MSTITAEPYAYAIGIAAEQREELVHSLDEAMDELTNCECVVTPLYAAPQQPADHVDGAEKLVGPAGASTTGLADDTPLETGEGDAL